MTQCGLFRTLGESFYAEAVPCPCQVQPGLQRSMLDGGFVPITAHRGCARYDLLEAEPS